MHFRSAQQHEYALPLCLPEIYQKALKYGHVYIPDTQCGPHGVQIRGVPVNRNMELINSVLYTNGFTHQFLFPL